MLKILVHEQTTRLDYICEVLFTHFVHVDYQIFTDKKVFQKTKGIPLLYGEFPVEGYSIPNAGLMKIGHSVTPEIGQTQDWPILFPVEGPFDLSFDLFSAAFYLVSRMEEYQAAAVDEHGRYLAEASLACKAGFLEFPIVEYWLQHFLQDLELRFPEFQVRYPTYTFAPTFDIDQAWAVRHYPLWRQLVSLPADVKRGDWQMLKARLNTWIKHQPDPYSTFGWIEHIHHKKEAPIFFFLLGDYNAYNKNVPWDNSGLKSLILYLLDLYEIGIHPGVYPDKGDTQAPKEKARLEQILQKPVTKSRQHYLRFRLPNTYEALEAMSIRNEYSMGYPKRPGFRAGCSRPYPWYHLRKEEKSPLMIHPISVMDVNLNQHLGLNPEQAKHKIQELVSAVRAVNGQFLSVWHNSSLSELNEWTGWKSVYEDLVRQATQQQ
ncbi:MAG: polysaccharide deacetylase family protein [Bacteroidota bacterium]